MKLAFSLSYLPVLTQRDKEISPTLHDSVENAVSFSVDSSSSHLGPCGDLVPSSRHENVLPFKFMQHTITGLHAKYSLY